uniref:Uncharacterized protein n=1 Tax=Anguilla anguilla TaxID=7936 RepID=A0A0E9THR8_ANGAN
MYFKIFSFSFPSPPSSLVLPLHPSAGGHPHVHPCLVLAFHRRTSSLL